ncbi:hypothetical protein SAMN05216249_101198 [Acetitomaculum ruminis DSM 5522]|uniref:AP2/ERF domain-containing protein n=1 Tax=Acetitomaculum ruminis DSM 5522 TaxID=1120918 RepID=A0A1I0V6Y8_9FIRM|nr:hypothetical protein [Acetitomaculum ruminis]SFA72134.1 hypothetical protein SAMN05216249_101198 [Acetitomaculum ruminis DSM 5522]
MKNFPGVYETIKKNGEKYYRASLTFRNKHISLGSFETSLDAHTAYLEGMEILHNKNITIDQFDSNKTILKFEKWVVLINFRENNIYIKTPIYIKKNYIYYYINQEEILKFDRDDLFYYSTHKIMKRNGHLFVADYGMQVNIASRYGIKNYAVCGKDYLFLNNDEYDFRYENIHIINKYVGVARQKGKNGRNCFKTTIHLNNNFVIGYYDSEIEAAVAYNKAVDKARMGGYDKNFEVNYIEELNMEEYSNIYSKVNISTNFLNHVKNSSKRLLLETS